MGVVQHLEGERLAEPGRGRCFTLLYTSSVPCPERPADVFHNGTDKAAEMGVEEVGLFQKRVKYPSYASRRALPHFRVWALNQVSEIPRQLIAFAGDEEGAFLRESHADRKWLDVVRRGNVHAMERDSTVAASDLICSICPFS